MPRFLFAVDEPSRERTALRFAVLFLSEGDHAALLERADAIRALRTARSDVCSLTLYANADWYTEPPFGDRTEALLETGTAARVDSERFADGVSAVRVDDERLRFDESTMTLACTTDEGLAVTTEGFEFGAPGTSVATIVNRTRAGDHVEWGLHMREVDGTTTPHLSIGVWFDLAPGEAIPAAIRDGASPEHCAAIDAAIAQLRAAIKDGG